MMNGCIILTYVTPLVSGNIESWIMRNGCVDTVKERLNVCKIICFYILTPLTPLPDTGVTPLHNEYTTSISKVHVSGNILPPKKENKLQFKTSPLFKYFQSIAAWLWLQTNNAPVTRNSRSITCSFHLFICGWDAILVIYLSEKRKK